MIKNALLAAAMLIPTVGLANPNKAPEFEAQVIEALALPAALVSEIEITDEDLSRNGLEASYYAGFTLSVAAPESTFIAVDSADDYVVIQRVLAAGQPIPVTGNVLGSYVDGAWQTQVNILEIITPGGRTLKSFGADGRAVLIAGETDLEAFLAEREEAQKLAHAAALAQIERDAAEELAADLQAQRAAAEKDEQARRFAQEAEARRIAERAASDAMMLALFTEGANFDVELAAGKQRLAGRMMVTRVTDALVEATATFDIGSGGNYTTPMVIRLTEQAGELNLEMPKVNDFRGSRSTCAVVATPNTEGGFIAFIDNRNGLGCAYELLIKGLAVSDKG